MSDIDGVALLRTDPSPTPTLLDYVLSYIIALFNYLNLVIIICITKFSFTQK